MGGGALQPMKELLISFGHSPRERNKNEPHLTESATQSAELLNGRMVKQKVQVHDGGRLHKLLHHSPPLGNEQIAEEMFLKMQEYTGNNATLEGDRRTFDAVAERRLGQNAERPASADAGRAEQQEGNVNQ
jgi:hypothetical protein